jgi:hypothetical protein
MRTSRASGRNGANVRTPRPARWAGVSLIIVVGLLQLHLPHYLAETSTPAAYARYPGPILVSVMIGSAAAAAGILRDRRWAGSSGSALP